MHPLIQVVGAAVVYQIVIWYGVKWVWALGLKKLDKSITRREQREPLQRP